MAYATFQQLASVFGENRLLSATPDSSSESALARWELYLEAGTAEIDTALSRQGYVLPFDLTGQEGVAALLAATCIALALEQGAPALIATPEGVKSAAQLARDRMSEWANGSRRLPFTIGQQIFASVPRVERTGIEPFVSMDDRIFDLLRVA